MQRHLLIDTASRVCAFGRFTEEILAAEGLTGFAVADLASDALPAIGEHDVLVLARAFPREKQIAHLLEAVHRGAGLVVLQPSPRLLERLDCELAATCTHPGWVVFDDMAIQTHVPMTHLAEQAEAWRTVTRATDAAWPVAPADRPAVMTRELGRGCVTAFLYDLPKAVARIRFGNPELVDTLTNGHWSWVHTVDLFTDHVDPRVSHLPQADLHGQLLAAAVEDASPAPLARLWYYPSAAHTTAAVVQSDDDWSTPEQFAALVGAIERHGGTATFYMMEQSLLPDGELMRLRERGHTFGPHVNAFPKADDLDKPSGRGVDLRESFINAMQRETQRFDQRYGRRSATLQSHCAPWAGYMEFVPLHVRHGYRMLFAYLSGPQPMINRFMCGSGRPMRFCDEDGVIHDCWQQPVTTYDDASLKPRIASEPASVLGEFDLIFRDAVARTHTAFTLLSHPVSFATYSQPFIEPCLARFAEAGAPIFNADQWLEFQDRRRHAVVKQRMNDDGAIEVAVDGEGPLCLMTPAVHGKTMTRLGRAYNWQDDAAGKVRTLRGQA